MSRSHPKRPTVPDRRRPSGIALLVVLIAVVTVIGLVLLWPRGSVSTDLSGLGIAEEVYRATVVESSDGPCSFAEDHTCRSVSFELREGPDVGTIHVQELPVSAVVPEFEEGDAVVLNHRPLADAEFRYQFADRERRGLLIAVALIFAVAVVALGRVRGLRALVGLGLSVAALLAFVMPAILDGRDPVLVAAVGGSFISLVALYLTHGMGRLTHVAAVGIFGALALTVLISTAAFSLAQFSGFASEEALFLLAIPEVGIHGLVLAGAVLGALGALDDVAVTQASAVWEVKKANPNMSASNLASAGLRVGRHHIASTVNTLLLAYAGAAMPLLLLFSLSNQSLSIVANHELVAVEILRTLVGSIGLVAAVPLTTWLAAREVTVRPPAPDESELHH